MSSRKVTLSNGREVTVPNFKKKPAGKSMPLAAKVSKLEKQLKLQEGEWKYIDTVFLATASVAAGTLTLLNGCTQGDGPSNREGTQIHIKSIQVRFRTEFNAADASAGIVRFVLFQDLQPNGAAPTVGNVYFTTTANAVDALRNLDNRKRFRILADRTHIVSPNGNSGYQEDIYLKKPIMVQYNAGNAGVVSDISTNSLYVLTCSDQAANGPFIAWYARVRFTE